ncbi:phosphoserine aminotransferase-like [Rhynchophorus ferrugineus]|uniref:Phosphoserine aminotransferase n=1 Tax=Rhynchophorus ferrugineus TaxID=354439 RepID=A0A834I1I7_RHYFE|nr:hypothetical protein GWI33_016068 [Rhynchophorus ferrugineus]
MEKAKSALNFGSGPSKLPLEVLEDVQKEFVNYRDIGFSITELSHRSEEYTELNQQAQDDLRTLLSVPDNYKILFTQGGGQGLLSAIPLNLIGENGTADYIITGIWSTVAANEAKKYGQINCIHAECDVPSEEKWNLNENASYLFYCDNETIEGKEFHFVPKVENIPIVADMSSSIMMKKIDVSKFGVIFAAAQKNLGTAGLGVVIVREDLLGRALNICPSFLNFTQLSQHNSILNTPPIFSIYLLSKVLKWVKQNGGLETMEQRCKEKSKLLYDTINESGGFYHCLVENTSIRSRINIPFCINGGDAKMEEKFLSEAAKCQIYQLKGHKLVGGIRVSLYNSISYNDVMILTDFMIKFKKENEKVIQHE